MAEKSSSLYQLGNKRSSELPMRVIESDLDDENVRNLVVLLRQAKTREEARAAIHRNGYLQITEIGRRWELRAGFGKEAELKMVMEWPLTTVLLEDIRKATATGLGAVTGMFKKSSEE